MCEASQNLTPLHRAPDEKRVVAVGHVGQRSQGSVWKSASCRLYQLLVSGEPPAAESIQM